MLLVHDWNLFRAFPILYLEIEAFAFGIWFFLAINWKGLDEMRHFGYESVNLNYKIWEENFFGLCFV